MLIALTIGLLTYLTIVIAILIVAFPLEWMRIVGRARIHCEDCGERSPVRSHVGPSAGDPRDYRAMSELPCADTALSTSGICHRLRQAATLSDGLPGFRSCAIMESNMATSVKQLIDEANAAVPKISPADMGKIIGDGNTLVVDVRDADEVRKTGKVAGAINVSRGMLEFRADPQSPYHDKNFATDKTVIVYCASGGRSALSGKALKDMGYQHVYNAGGFKDWAESGGAIDKTD